MAYVDLERDGAVFVLRMVDDDNRFHADSVAEWHAAVDEVEASTGPAALVTAEPHGIALRDFRSATLPDTADLITWRIGDQGFDMHLSGKVPARIATALRAERERNDDGGVLRGDRVEDTALWAVHAGGRTVLDAVEIGLELPGDALAHSRGVLHDVGNVSSATIMFVLARMLERETGPMPGVAMAFGPGVAAETFRFNRV